MEKKKLLLVAVSVGLFLVIVVGAAILVFSPRNYQNITKVEEVPIAPGITKPAPEVAVTVIPEGTPKTESPKIETPPEARQYNSVEIIIRGDGTDVAAKTLKNDERKTITITNPNDTNTVPVKPAAPAVTKAPTPAEKKVTSNTASAPKKTEVPKDGYWVQTGSFSKKALADNAKKYLADKGITSVIMNGDVGGRTYYRVRVGPYLSKNEADYWLSLIQSIEGMENSQVWKSRL